MRKEVVVKGALQLKKGGKIFKRKVYFIVPLFFFLFANLLFLVNFVKIILSEIYSFRLPFRYFDNMVVLTITG